VGIANASAVVLVCHGRLTSTALVLRCERLSAKNNFCDEQTHLHKSGGRQPAVVFRTASTSAVRRTSAFGSRVLSASHGGLTPPAALGTGTTTIRRKNDDSCDEQTRAVKSGGRQPAVVREIRLRRHEGDCSENRRQYVGRSPLPSRPAIPRGAYAPRSWSGMRALRELGVFQVQIRPEHRCVRERAQHTCVFHLQTRYVHHSWRTPSAPGCVCGRCCKCAIVADEKDAFPRGAYAPRSCC
jgi:hypothetical protein